MSTPENTHRKSTPHRDTHVPPQSSTLSMGQMRTLLILASSQLPVDGSSHEDSSTWEQVAAAHSSIGNRRTQLERAMNPTTPLSELRQIKDASKQSLASVESLDQRDAAVLLYHVAVAAAHAYHATNISSRPSTAQHRLFGDLALAFDGEALAQVFQAAAAATHE
jgi:hypothetical protein